jgi:hypothetical protein
VAWRDFWRVGWLARRARDSGEAERREQSTEEGGLARNGAGIQVRVRRGSKGSWGAWAGDVAGDLGVRARWSKMVRGEGGADTTAPRRRERERESGRTTKRFSVLTGRAHEAERDKGRASEGDWCRQNGPIGRRERGRERVRRENCR